MKKYIVGLGGSEHDFSVSIIDENANIKIAIEDERLNGIRYGRDDRYSVPTKVSYKYCKDYLKFNDSDIAYIFSNNHLEDIAYTYIDNTKLNEKISHHESHASSFYQSNYDKATLIVIDGNGTDYSKDHKKQFLETVSIGEGIGNKIRLKTFHTGNRYLSTAGWKYITSNSIGYFYEIITDIIGFGEYGSGKTMGLASYGDKSLLNDMMKFIEIKSDGKFIFNPYSGFFDWAIKTIKMSKNKFKIKADLAFAAQYIFDEVVIKIFNHAYKLFPNDSVVYSGGCALNVTTNYKILNECKFKNIFIHPAPGDNGTSIGAALYGYYNILGNKRKINNDYDIGLLAYQGRIYKDKEILEALNSYSIFYRESKNLIQEISNELINNKVIAWFQDGSEVGPRALGHRSIFASPLSSKMKDHININIKSRETFRPLAPIIPYDDLERFFDFSYYSPFMQFAVPIKDKFIDKLLAISHIDNTARVQTITNKTNEKVYSLLKEFEKLSGYPILINTSFNIEGKPIVETPSNAIEAFINSNIDILVIHNFIVEKHTPWIKRKVTNDF